MVSRYKIAFGIQALTGTAMQAQTVRDAGILDPYVSLVEQTASGTYEADAGLDWIAGDDIIYYYNGTIVASETYKPEAYWRTNTK